jgi:hypothetical protein
MWQKDYHDGGLYGEVMVYRLVRFVDELCHPVTAPHPYDLKDDNDGFSAWYIQNI